MVSSASLVGYTLMRAFGNMNSSKVLRMHSLMRPTLMRGCATAVPQSSVTCKAYAAAPAQATYNEQSGSPVYGSQFDVYKGKAAVQFKPIGATFAPYQSGVEVKRKGTLLMELANVNSGGKRSYDWANKVTFALSVTEMASLFLSNSVLQGQQVSLFHDPNMQSEFQGKVAKSLKANLMQDGQNIGIMVSDNSDGQNRTVSVQLSAAEFMVVAEMCRFLIPRALGLDRAV